ncbi:hypothetical protein bAD24_I06485 [Burkholderia sp. AD24]|nr:hypothetical protein bAD24_I06485 [Burkholderia sp. AD24]
MIRLASALTLIGALAGCVVAPAAPDYGYVPVPAYGYGPGYYAAPSIGVGIGFGGSWGGHGGWHGR